MIYRRLGMAGFARQLGLLAARAGLVLATLTLGSVGSSHAQIYYSQDFEGLTLEAPVDEVLPPDEQVDNVWSPTAPTGWTVDRTGVPAGGVTEWRGWNFVEPNWWTQVAGGARADFAVAEHGNVVAVADGDQWRDLGSESFVMKSIMKTPAISLTGISSGTSLSFDSSWRREDLQYGELSASFDGGAAVKILRLDSSDTSDDYYPDATFETVEVPVTIPNGAKNVSFSWTYSGDDDYWWAIDNISFGNSYKEDFESVDLGKNVMEGHFSTVFDYDHVYTHNGPAGYTINNEGVPLIEEDGIGVTEWKGWSFANKDFWTLVAGDQNRTYFSKGKGTVAIADPDEWDDLGNPTQGETFNTIMNSPKFSVAGAAAGSLTLNLDSSWRPECCDDEAVDNSQTAVISVSYDDGKTFKEVLRWDSTPDSEFFHPDSENESVAIALNNPAGATSAILQFSLLDSENDWWWAIDNLVVSGTGGGKRGDFNGDGVLDSADIDALTTQSASGANVAKYDLTGDGSVNSADVTEWIKADDIKKSWVGDADLDGQFNSNDLVTVLIAGKYETGDAAVWSEGDFDGDGGFTSGDLVAALIDGGYEIGPRAAVSAVPEPASLTLFALGGLFCIRRRK